MNKKEVNVPTLGKEQQICDCGNELDVVKVYYENNVVNKICPQCKKEYFLDVSF